jgi:hypothetical protein
VATFLDYNRTVIGYHGTSREIAEQLVLGRCQFEPSRNEGDWLGHGVYFWEHAPKQAWCWVNDRNRRRKLGDVAVVASMIRLGNCLDLLDPDNVDALKPYHDSFLKATAGLSQTIKRNVRSKKYLDKSVLETAYAHFAERGSVIDTCRAVYVPSSLALDGKERRAWKTSSIYRTAHIQLCVRNTACIMGTWLVQPVQGGGDDDQQARFRADAHAAS